MLQSRGIRIHSMVIAGQIEGHFAAAPQCKSTKYEECIPTLVAVEENDGIDGLLLLLNTVGGDIEAGLAIAELISGMTKPTVSLVLGGGHSIGVPLAVAARYSFIVPSATMTIHPVRISGVVIGVPQTYYYFERMQDRIINLQRGDLLFFGTPASSPESLPRVTHIGIYLGEGMFIHSSQVVRRNSLLPDNKAYYENSHRLVAARRL